MPCFLIETWEEGKESIGTMVTVRWSLPDAIGEFCRRLARPLRSTPAESMGPPMKRLKMPSRVLLGHTHTPYRLLGF